MSSCISLGYQWCLMHADDLDESLWQFMSMSLCPADTQRSIKGALLFGTFKSIDFKKNWYVKVPVVPRSLML